MSSLQQPRGYQEDFDPGWYLSSYYQSIEGNPEEGDLLSFFVDSLHEIFAPGTIHGEKLLDIGTGPTVHSVISASRHVTEIHLSDFADRNRAVLQEWLEGAPNVPAIFTYILGKENDGTTIEDRETAVRVKVKKIYYIDLLQPTPIENLSCTYDVITSSLCLEAAAKTLEEYSNIVDKISGMLKSKGYLVMMGVLRENFYQVGDFRFDCLNISGEQLKTIMSVKFDIKVWRESANEKYDPNNLSTEVSDFESSFVMVAQKRG